MYKKILVAFDGSPGACKALKRAVKMAYCFDAELHSTSVEVDLPRYVATVGEIEEVKRQKDEYFEQLNKEEIELTKAEGVRLTPHVVAGHSRIYERIWGGVPRNLARFSPCPVLIEK